MFDLLPIYQEYKNCHCIYVIQKENLVYIGQTSNIISRLGSYCKQTHNDDLTDLLKNPDKIFIIEKLDDFNLKNRLVRETHWINEYKNNGFTVINKLNNKPKKPPKIKCIMEITQYFHSNDEIIIKDMSNNLITKIRCERDMLLYYKTKFKRLYNVDRIVYNEHNWS